MNFISNSSYSFQLQLQFYILLKQQLSTSIPWSLEVVKKGISPNAFTFCMY